MNFIEGEREYHWLDAAEAFKQNLQFKADNCSSTAESWKKIGYC